MILTKYPEYVEMQLKQLDEKIAEIYEQDLGEFQDTASVCNIQEIERKKKIIYERTKPFLDEKVRLIENSCPKYIVTKDWY